MSKIVSLQILRGVAATLVAGFHLFAAAEAEGTDPGLFRLFSGGEIGVDVFFVISGFIIFYISRNRPGMTRSAFLQSRFWRILPPYWTILSLYILAAVALAVLLGDRSKLPSGSSLLISYLLLPHPDHVIVIAWTLSLEILFYALFAATFFGGGAPRLIAAMVLWAAAAQAFVLLVEDKPVWLLIPLQTAALEFLFGILIAVRFCASNGRRPPLHLPAFVAGAAGVLLYSATGGIHVDGLGREITAGVFAALLVYGALGFSLGDMPVLETWGESSYILYLLHILWFSIVGKAVEVLAGVNVYASQAGMLALLITVVMASYAGVVWLERPYQRWYRRLIARPAALARPS